MNERSPCDNQMAGCEAEPTPERPAGGTCDRQFVAESCHLIAGLAADGFESPHAEGCAAISIIAHACNQCEQASTHFLGRQVRKPAVTGKQPFETIRGQLAERFGELGP